MRHQTRWWLAVVFAALGVLAPAMAQEYRGNLFVEVVDEGGSPLQGVTVTAAGRDFSRVLITGSDGKARFTRLEPGPYQLTAAYENLRELRMEDVQINTLANVALTITLSPVEGLEERVVVTARTPLLDQRRTGATTVLTQAELSQIPTSRDPWAVLSTVPGVTTDRVNVGGNEAGQQSNFVANGDSGANTTWVMDGVEFTDIGAIGATSSYLDFNSFEEIGFVTSGGDVEQPNGGLRMNFTTKQGANSMRGNVRLWYATIGLQSDVSGLSQPAGVDLVDNPLPNNQINEVFEKNFDLGGPMWKDHMWYWFGFSQNDVDVLINQASDRTKLQNTSYKLHGQLAHKVDWKAFYTTGDKIKSGRGLAVTRPPETTWDQKGPTPIYTGYLSYVFNPNHEISVQYGHVGGKFSLTPKGGLDAQIINDANNVWNGSFVLYSTVRPQDQYVVKGTSFANTGSWEHEVKYGYRYKKSTVESLSKWSNSDFYVYSGAYIYLYRERNLSLDAEHTHAWASDTVTHGPWAINAGLSYTDQTGVNNPTNILPVGICPTCFPGLNFAGTPETFQWTDTSPRLGASYTFDMEKRLLLRANYSQFVDQLGAADITYNSPAAGYLYIVQPWTDTDGNGQVDPGPPGSTGEIGYVPLDTSPGEIAMFCSTSTNSSVDCANPNGFFDKIDPDFEAPKSTAWTLGAEYELAPDFTIGVNVFNGKGTRQRWTDGNLDGRPVASTGPLYDLNIYGSTGQLVPLAPGDYECTSTIGTGALPDGTPYSVAACQITSAAKLAGRTDDAEPSFLTNRSGYEATYKGFDFTATKRLSDKWMMRGFFQYADWDQSFSGLSGISDPTNFQGGTLANDSIALPSVGSGTKDGVWLGTSRWQVNLNGLYQLPRDMTISGNLYGREGYGIPYIDRLGPKDVQIGSVKDFRYEDLWTLDLRFAKLLKLQGSTVELSAEVFNALDANTVLSRRVRADLASADAITENLSPRIVRFGATVSF